MKKGYIQAASSAVEFQQIIESMNKAGVSTENIVLNQSFSEFTTSLNSGDIVVVSDLSIFGSASELLTEIIYLLKQNITIESIDESWFVLTPNDIDLLQKIHDLERKLRRTRTQQGLSKARANGKKLGRPLGSTKFNKKVEDIQRLCHSQGISITKACKIVGCHPRTYYRNLVK